VKAIKLPVHQNIPWIPYDARHLAMVVSPKPGHPTDEGSLEWYHAVQNINYSHWMHIICSK